MPSTTVPKTASNLPSKGTQQSPLLEDTELREPQSGCEIDPNSVVLPIQSNSPQLKTSDTYQTPESPITRDLMDTHPSRECHLQPVVEEDVVITGESQKSRGNTLMMIDHNPQESGNTYGDTKEKGCHGYTTLNIHEIWPRLFRGFSGRAFTLHWSQDDVICQ